MNWKLQDIKGYKIFETINDRGMRGACRGYYLTKQEADLARKHIGWWGEEGAIDYVTILVLEDDKGVKTYYEAKPISAVDWGVDPVKVREKLKSSALAKLTDNEKQALGLM